MLKLTFTILFFCTVSTKTSLNKLEKMPLILSIKNINNEKKRATYDKYIKGLLKKQKFEIVTEVEGQSLFQAEFERRIEKYKGKYGFPTNGNQEEIVQTMAMTPSIGRKVDIQIFYTPTIIDSIAINAINFYNSERAKKIKLLFTNNTAVTDSAFINQILDSCIRAKYFYVETK